MLVVVPDNGGPRPVFFTTPNGSLKRCIKILSDTYGKAYCFPGAAYDGSQDATKAALSSSIRAISKTIIKKTSLTDTSRKVNLEDGICCVMYTAGTWEDFKNKYEHRRTELERDIVKGDFVMCKLYEWNFSKPSSRTPVSTLRQLRPNAIYCVDPGFGRIGQSVVCENISSFKLSVRFDVKKLSPTRIPSSMKFAASGSPRESPAAYFENKIRKYNLAKEGDARNSPSKSSALDSFKLRRA